MKYNRSKASSILRVSEIREDCLLDNKTKLHRLAVTSAIMLSWLLIWALVFKLGSVIMLERNYTNLKGMTLEERIMWDLVPFNYEGKGIKQNLIMDTVLNCLVFAPLAVILCFAFEKKNIFKNVALCLVFSLFIETMQLFTMLGNPATEDLITNTIGCIIGHIIYSLFFRRLSVWKSTVFLRAVTFILALAVVFSLVTTAMAAELIIKIITRTL